MSFDDARESDGADENDQAGDANDHKRGRPRELWGQLHILIKVELRPQTHNEDEKARQL